MNGNESETKNESDGRFIETAFSSEQVDAAVRAEIEHGIEGGPCGFVAELNKPVSG